MKPIHSKNNASFFVGLIIIAILIAIVIFQKEMTQRAERTLLSGKPLPLFSLPSLFDSATRVTNQSLAGHVFLLNFWASWCLACQTEHATLLMIANTYAVPIYGIAYKDTIQNAKAWLQMAGNPYAMIAIDARGSLDDAFALSGIPETFVVDKKGMIRYRYLGALTQADWERILRPVVERYEKL